MRILAFAVTLFLGWTATVAGSLWVNAAGEREHTVAVATEVARAAAHKDLAYRFWAARQGGVYVPVSGHTPPNPYLAHLHRRDVVTDQGQKLTLVNPAYMTRQVHELAREAFGAQGHITSLQPLRPENAPDAWEAEALRRAAAGGEREIVEVREREGGPALRYLKALIADKPCLSCHGIQGYREGELRGGLGVEVAMGPFLAAEGARLRQLWWGHGAVWLMGAVAIGWGAGRLRSQLRHRERQEGERLRLEQQLFRAQRLEALGRLSGGVAHDFNNLLTPILGNAEAVLADLPPGSPLREDLEDIRGAASRARDLVLRLLAFGRQQPDRSEPVDLAEIAAGLERMLQRLLGEDVEVRLQAQPGAPRALADRAQVELALVNLALNARDAMPQGGRLTIRSGAEEVAADAAGRGLRAGSYAVLEVADTGTGMDEETRAHLFEPFFTTKGRGRGTGLGLATVHTAMRRAGGDIEVRSVPGQGSTFRLLLPATAAAPRPTRPEAAPPRGREAVLVVEDDEQVRRYLSAALSSLGYAVRSAASPTEALALAAGGERVDLVVSDVAMPEMRGPELWRRLAPLLPGARVLFVSAHAGLELAGREDGEVEPLLAKPFTAAELGFAVRAALEAGSAERAGA